MLCGQCGHTITAEVKKRKYVYYHCTGFGKSHKPTYVRESTLHSQFAQLISQVALPDGWYNYLKECLESESMRRDRVLKTQRNRIESARSKVIADMKKTFQAKLDGLLDNDFFQEVFRDLQSRKESLERQDQALESGADSLYDTALETIELANQIESLYLEANSSQRRELLRTVLSNCYLDGTNLRAAYRKPFDLLAKGVLSNNKLGDRDSNPDSTVQSRMSYRWTISQSIFLSFDIRLRFLRFPSQNRKVGPNSSANIHIHPRLSRRCNRFIYR